MKRIAAYCRVSTDKEDQANSFENQQHYFRSFIDREPDWDLYEIYADEGITGTSTKKRAAFNRMIADARLGRFDMIITKEVSRFSRNVVDTLNYSRELKRIGIGIYFLNDGLNTIDADAELRLTIMASFAQEESRRTSQRVKWGQTRQMEKGVVFGCSMLGYDVKNGVMTINPDGAEIVRQIFHKYVHERKGCCTIARELREAGCQTANGNVRWTNTVILRILKNEKYCGDLLQKKTYTPDYLSHGKKYNHGQEEKVYIRDHHEPIISRELWEQAQAEAARRDVDGGFGSGHGNRFPMSGRIKCGECGASFASRRKKRMDGSQYKCWRCGTACAEGARHIDKVGNRVGCDVGYQIRDELAMHILRTSVDTLRIDKAAVAKRITAIVTDVLRQSEQSEQLSAEKLERDMASVEEKKKRVLDSFFDGSITKEEMRMMNDTYDQELTALAGKLVSARKRQNLNYSKKDVEKDVRHRVTELLRGSGDDTFYGNLLDHMTVYKENRIEVHLRLLPTKWTYALTNIQDE